MIDSTKGKFLVLKVIAQVLILTTLHSTCFSDIKQKSENIKAVTTDNFFYKGGDISMLLDFEQKGMRIYENGKAVDLIKIMSKYGCNTFRIRKFVNPSGEKGVIQDLDYVLKLGKRIKSSKSKFLLDLHYSDTWADPMHQKIPKEWEKLSFEELLKTVENYTYHILSECKKNECPPDLVQIGNEIQTGIMKPWGAYDKKFKWEKYCSILKSGIKGAKKALPNIKIILHTHAGGNHWAVRDFSQRLLTYKVRYDFLGLSYYPEWQGPLDNLKKSLVEASKFHKPVIVVETAYHHNGLKAWYKVKENSFDYDFSPKGQYKFLKDLIHTVKKGENNIGKGVLYWFPESIKFSQDKVWADGNRALFDKNGVPLPALEAFSDEQKKMSP